jgi:hypothetical protein
VRQITTTLVLALCLLGCGSKEPPGEPVQLLTGAMPFDEDECTADYVASELIFDPEFGTALAGLTEIGGDRYPVMWRPGFTGIRDGARVVVVDPNGKAVATTGESYRLAGHILFRVAEEGFSKFKRGTVLSLIDVDMFYACGLVRPEPTSVPPGEQCGLSFPCPSPSLRR